MGMPVSTVPGMIGRWGSEWVGRPALNVGAAIQEGGAAVDKSKRKWSPEAQAHGSPLSVLPAARNCAASPLPCDSRNNRARFHGLKPLKP